MTTLKTLREIFIPEVTYPLYCNVPDVYFIYHGTWSDPEVMYEDKLFNLPVDVEEPLWNNYECYCEENGIKASDDGFAEYVESNPDELYEVLNYLIECGMFEEV